MQAILSLYATGRTTGVVLDCGDGVTQAVPIYGGFAMSHSIMRTDVAGRDVTRHLQLLLRREGHIFRTSSEMEIVRTIKEKACYVAKKPKKEEQAELEQASQKNYVLPDGEQIQIGASKFRAPEVLFNPNLIGDEGYGGTRLGEMGPRASLALLLTPLPRPDGQVSTSRSCIQFASTIWISVERSIPTLSCREDRRSSKVAWSVAVCPFRPEILMWGP